MCERKDNPDQENALLAKFRQLLGRHPPGNGNGRHESQPAAVASGKAGAGKPKVLFIMPKMPSTFGGMQFAAPYGEYKYFNCPLGVMTLAAIISPEYEVEIRDENVGPVDYDTDADIVGISGFLLESFHVGRMIVLSQYFKAKGKVVCAGGPVANLMPDVVRDHFDVLFEGEGELTWPEFLKDYEAGSYKPSYQQADMVSMDLSPVPRIDLVNPRDYAMGTVQTTRGCPFTCEFCDIIIMYGRKVRTKAIEQVVKEVEIWADAGMEAVFFADDNFVGNRPYCKDLLRELIKFNSKRKHAVHFSTQASIDMSRDKELLELMEAANFSLVFIGIESPRKDSLAETLKMQNVHTLDLEQAIHTIQSYGMFVTGGMIVGFDHDDIGIFDEQYNFLQRAGVIFPMMNVLIAAPKTPLYYRMEEAGRLYDYSDKRLTNIKPVCMTYDELETNYLALVRKVYTYDAILERHMHTLDSMRNCRFSHDRPWATRRNIFGLIKTTAYYLFTTNNEKRRFFFRMLKGCQERNPRAIRHVLRHLCMYIHMQEHFRRKENLSMAPPTREMREHDIVEPPEREVVQASQYIT